MRPKARMSKQELTELIKSIEEGGGDATDLRALLAEVESDERKRSAPRKPQGAHKTLASSNEEETAEERLNRRVGNLFPNGIPYKEILDYDYRFILKELREQCRKAGLSVSGDKHELAAKLIANKTIMPKPTTLGNGEVRIVREETEEMEEDHESYPILPEEVSFPVLFKEVWAKIDDVGSITYTYFPSVKVGHIEMVNVVLSHRGRGLGRKLLQFALDDMQKKGITKVSANIWSKEGERLFKAFGFYYVGKGTLAVKRLLDGNR